MTAARSRVFGSHSLAKSPPSSDPRAAAGEVGTPAKAAGLRGAEPAASTEPATAGDPRQRTMHPDVVKSVRPDGGRSASENQHPDVVKGVRPDGGREAAAR